MYLASNELPYSDYALTSHHIWRCRAQSWATRSRWVKVYGDSHSLSQYFLYAAEVQQILSTVDATALGAYNIKILYVCVYVSGVHVSTRIQDSWYVKHT